MGLGGMGWGEKLLKLMDKVDRRTNRHKVAMTTLRSNAEALEHSSKGTSKVNHLSNFIKK